MAVTAKSKRLVCFVLSCLFIICLLSGTDAHAASDSLTFTYAGKTYTITKGNSGSGDGISWTCDNRGNAVVSFNKSGTFTVISGSANYTAVKLIGGGAGGSSGTYNKSGAGGGGGVVFTKTGITGFNSSINKSFDVVIGAGGAGAAPSSSTWCEECTPVSYNIGSAGGTTSLATYRAAGGKGDGGGSSVSGIANGIAGKAATSTSGASGGSGGCFYFTYYWETGFANYTSGHGLYSCWMCGANWSPQYLGYFSYDRTLPSDTGGAAIAIGSPIGGAGASGENGNSGAGANACSITYNHSCNGTSADGSAATGYGNGGGGGGVALNPYRLGGAHGHGPGGSSAHNSTIGKGGDGSQGYAELSIYIGAADDEGRPGGGGGYYGGKSSNSTATAGGGSGYVGSKASGNTYSGINSNIPSIPDGSKNGYIRIIFKQ